MSIGLLSLPTDGVGDQITREGQVQLDNVLLGPETRYVARLEGLGTGESRGSITNRPGQDGGDPSDEDFEGPHTIRMNVSFADDIGQPLGPLADALASPFAKKTDTIPLAFWRYGDPAPRVYFVRPRRFSYNIDGAEWRLGIARGLNLELIAPDPALYGLIKKSGILNIPEPAGGRTYPRTYPLTYGGGISGDLNAQNDGNRKAWPTIKVYGPITNPSLRNNTTDQTLSFSLVIGSGDFLEVDFRQRTVLLGGTASRYNSIVGFPDWWPIQPGSNFLTLLADSAGEGHYAEVFWRDAYIG